MGISRAHWRVLNYIIARNEKVRTLVVGWVDDPYPEAYITRWVNRFFLSRLVHRAYRELSFTGGREPFCVGIILSGDEVTTVFGTKCQTRKILSHCNVEPYEAFELDSDVEDLLASEREDEIPFPFHT